MSENQTPEFINHICAIFPDPVFVLDEDGTYVDIAGGNERSLYDSPNYLKDLKLRDVFPADEADRLLAVVRDALQTNSLHLFEYQLSSADMNFNPKDGPDTPQWYQGRVYPLRLPDETVGHVIWVAINITEQKQAEIERDKVTRELKTALSEIQTLQGILPICASCKKIRDDAGYWSQIEEYFLERSDIQFSHALCPECVGHLYPGLDVDELDL